MRHRKPSTARGNSNLTLTTPAFCHLHRIIEPLPVTFAILVYLWCLRRYPEQYQSDFDQRRRLSVLRLTRFLRISESDLILMPWTLHSSFILIVNYRDILDRAMRLLLQSKTISSLLKSRSWSRIRQQRHNSSTPSTPEPSQNQQSKNANNTDANTSNNQLHGKQPTTFSSSPPSPQNQPPSGSIASSAGGSTTPVPTRSLREVIQAGPVGKLGRAYSRVQQRRPYATQLCSSVVVYLCGDLSAQLWFPSEPVKPKDKEEGKGEGTDGGGSTYDRIGR